MPDREHFDLLAQGQERLERLARRENPNTVPQLRSARFGRSRPIRFRFARRLHAESRAV